MAIDKLIPQYLNQDTDQKLVKSVEMTDNLNVRVSTNSEGTDGVVKNIKGTEVASAKTAQDEFPAGENRVIGTASNERGNEIIFFLWNSGSEHGVYRLDTVNDEYTKLYEDSVLAFNKFSLAQSDIIINEEEDTIVYWTDNINPPRKLNVTRLINGGYGSTLTSGTDEEKNSILAVAKRQPSKSPSYTYVSDGKLLQAGFYEKNFQFAYQYKYNDGELSALSSYSSLSVSPDQYKDGFITEEEKQNYNAIDVTVENSTEDVEEIILYARVGNTGGFFEVERVDVDSAQTQTIRFRDNKISRYLSNDEQNKTYDNVPQLAKAICIVDNRLMFGNYTEGYENAFIDATLTPVYHVEAEVFSMRAYNYNTTDKVIESSYTWAGNQYTSPQFAIDFSNVPDSVEASSEVIIDISFIAESISVEKSGVNKEFGEIEFTYEDSDNDSIDTAAYEVGNPNLVNNDSRGTCKMGLQPIMLSYRDKVASTMTKADFISSVVVGMLQKDYYSIVDGDETNEKVYDYSTLAGLAGAEAVGVFGGKAGWKLSADPVVNDTVSFTLIFAGAEVYLKYLYGKTGNWFVNQFTLGTKKLNVLESSTVKIGGLTAQTLFDGDTSTDPIYRQYGIAGSSCFGGQLEGEKSYKSNATHEFGVVYSDEFGRKGGVNKLGETRVLPKPQRVRNGHVEIDLRLASSPPSWAKSWTPVYGRNKTYEKFLQYTTGYALAALDSEKVASSSYSSKIYIGMNTLEGTESSYKDQTGARIEYKYNEGDKLEIIKYYDDTTGEYVYPEKHVFNVVGYEYIDPVRAEKFLAQTGKQKNIEGWYLIVENKELSGFSYNDVIAGTSTWNNYVLAEIKTLKKQTDTIAYYEFGKTYPVVNGEHQSDRLSSTLTGGFTVSIVFQSPKTGIASSTDRYYAGDYVDLGNDIIIEITEVVPIPGGFIYYFNWSRTSPVASTYNTATITNPAAVITMSEGDVYHRVRKLRSKNTFFDEGDYPDSFRKNSFLYDVGYIEDESVSDFFVSNSISIGKPYAYQEDARTIRRKSSITYSDKYVIDSDRMNLSSFNLSLANWSDMDIKNGGIDAIVERGDSLTVLQESKASLVPVSRNVIEYADGNAGVTVSRNVLGSPSYYAGEYGTSGWAGSVINRFGAVYYADVNSGKVIRLSTDGVTVISDNGMESFFNDRFEALKQAGNTNRVVGGFDPDTDEYLLTVEGTDTATISFGQLSYDIDTDVDGNISTSPSFTSSTILWNGVDIDWNNLCQEWQDVGNGIVYIDFLENGSPNSVLIDSVFTGGTGTISVIVTNTGFDFVAIGTFNLDTNELSLPQQTCGGQLISIDDGQSQIGFTIGYKHKGAKWSSKYGFKPTAYANIDNSMYSFFENSEGLVWRHNVNEQRCFIYGEQQTSMFEVASNYNPSMVKVYEALGIEGNGSFEAEFENDSQYTYTSDFSAREGHSYAQIPRDVKSSTSHKTYLGVVESISGNDITFTAPINRIPFSLGSELKKANLSNLVSTGNVVSSLKDRKTLTCPSIVTGVSVGDQMFIEHQSIVDGDPMRGSFMKVKLTSSDSTPYEVHALSLSYDRSRLHNERVN